MADANYDITVGIPTYNRSNCLEKAVESARAQKGINIEIVVSDNHSTDSTPQIMARYGNVPNIKYIRNTLNIGPVANYNQCLNHANGKYFMILGDDDWLSDEYCKILIDSLNEEDAVFLGKCIAITPDGAILHESSNEGFELAGLDCIEGVITKNPKLTRHANFMLAAETQAFREVGGFPYSDAGQHSDNMLLMRLLTTRKVVYNPGAINYYSVYPGSYGNKNVLSVSVASLQYINYWDGNIAPQLVDHVTRTKLGSLRRNLIHSVSLLYIGRVVKYGDGLVERIKLLSKFPRYSWLLTSLLSKSFAKTLFNKIWKN
jgi:glycosyltransferase involved in cell wall biosynthesis